MVQLLLPRDHLSWNPWEHTCGFDKHSGSATFGRISWEKNVEIHFLKISLLGVKCHLVEGKLLELEWCWIKLVANLV